MGGPESVCIPGILIGDTCSVIFNTGIETVEATGVIRSHLSKWGIREILSLSLIHISIQVVDP